ncbi:MAG: MOSC domain-containing protein [Actinomycetota bacterium]
MGAGSDGRGGDDAADDLPVVDDHPVVVDLHIAPASRLPMQRRESVEAEAGVGLVGDRYHGSRHRHVTVQAVGALAAAAADLGRPIDSGATRRNITISGSEVPTEIGRRFLVGPVEVEVVRIAAPCKLLDDGIGNGARTALRRRAGTVCRLLGSGTIAIGDAVDLDPPGGQPDREPPER